MPFVSAALGKKIKTKKIRNKNPKNIKNRNKKCPCPLHGVYPHLSSLCTNFWTPQNL
jgi:hypothetical protein